MQECTKIEFLESCAKNTNKKLHTLQGMKFERDIKSRGDF